MERLVHQLHGVHVRTVGALLARGPLPLQLHVGAVLEVRVHRGAARLRDVHKVEARRVGRVHTANKPHDRRGQHLASTCTWYKVMRVQTV
eukprot:7089686-Prymnesium_polylepis.1